MKKIHNIRIVISEQFRKFTSSQKISGILLLVVSVTSLLVSNSVWSDGYINFWEKEIFKNGNTHVSLLHFINDGLMTVFFLLIGLEIKREVIDGELTGFSRASLPVAAAVGGMIFPALIYSYFNSGMESSVGWGIPMATDIAFAIGIISLLGDRVSAAGKILITALAVVDDLGAVIVIAVFYSVSINSVYLLLAGAITMLLSFFNYKRVANVWLYIVPGIFLWYFILMSGIHSTIAGVILAATIPFYKSKTSLLMKMENQLHTVVNFLIMPLFAMANTAIVIEGNISEHLMTPESMGISFGLIFGKPIGILLMIGLMVYLRISSLPQGLNFRQLSGLGFLGGIGFTMSIFISMLAFKNADFVTNAKIAIVISSLIAGTTGFLILKLNRKSYQNGHEGTR